MKKKLKDLKVGETGKIISYGGSGKLKQHLLGLGFVQNTEIKLIRVSPLGDPIEVEIKGFEISLRKDEAENIEVEVN